MDVDAASTATLDPKQSLPSLLPPGKFSQQLLNAMLAFRSGDFAARMPTELTGIDGKIADAFNEIAALSERRARESPRGSPARSAKKGSSNSACRRPRRGGRLGRRSLG